MNKPQLIQRLLLVLIVVAIGGCVLPMSGHYYKLHSRVGTAIGGSCTHFGGPQSVLQVKRDKGRLYLHAIRLQNSTIVLLGYISEHSNSPIINLADIRLVSTTQDENLPNTARTVTIEKFLWAPVAVSGCKCKGLPFSKDGVQTLSHFVRVQSFTEAVRSHNRNNGPPPLYQLIQMRISPSVDKFYVMVPSMTIGRNSYPAFSAAFNWSEGVWLPPPMC
ncbi:MAG: hypothetical protein ACREHG_05455 [Candidatus Saccharimonadales bacterium]